MSSSEYRTPFSSFVIYLASRTGQVVDSPDIAFVEIQQLCSTAEKEESMILSFDHTTSLTIMKIDIYWSERVYAGRGGPLLESPGNLTYPEQYFNIKISKREKLALAPKVVYSVSLNKSVFS